MPDEDLRYDEESLRAAQLRNWSQRNGKVADENPENTPKTYAALTKVWMPLILDVVGKEPWTVEEVLNAMKPVIVAHARSYSRMQPAFQFDDAVSVGQEAVLSALAKDQGRAPFGPYAANEVRRAIQKAVAASSFIKAPERKRTYTGGIPASLDRPLGGEDEGGISQFVSTSSPQVERTRCSVCGGSGVVPSPEAEELPPLPKVATREEVRRIKRKHPDWTIEQINQELSKRGKAVRFTPATPADVKAVKKEHPEYDEIQVEMELRKHGKTLALQPCDRCGGTGRMSVRVPTDTPAVGGRSPNPMVQAIRREKLHAVRRDLATTISKAELSPRQLEIVLLMHGLEGLYDRRLRDTGETRDTGEVVRILSIADAIHHKDPNTGARSGIWAEAQKAGKEDEFLDIWDEAFNRIGMNRPFFPDLPTSLQIAPLHDRSSAPNDALGWMIEQLQQRVADVPVHYKSNTLIRNTWAKALSRLQAASDVLKKHESESSESVERQVESVRLAEEDGGNDFRSLDMRQAEGAVAEIRWHANKLAEAFEKLRNQKRWDASLDDIEDYDYHVEELAMMVGRLERGR